MRLLRVFPRRTAATPDDAMCRFDEPGLFDPPECDEVHVSVTFTWDRTAGERLRRSWSAVHPRVRIGGPAFDDRGGEFEPGRYLKPGHVITSRGCPNRCWFCDVPKREGALRELPIRDGVKVHDSNLLACSRAHIEAVFAMLSRQSTRPEFLGGLEAARLENWHTDRIVDLKPRRLFCAYDTPDDLEPLLRAGSMLHAVTERYCYVLIGYKGDTFPKAERRCCDTMDAGFMPFAMLWRDADGKYNTTWRRFQRVWCRPQIVRSKMRARDAAAVLQENDDARTRS